MESSELRFVLRESIPITGILLVWGSVLGVVLVFPSHVAVDGDWASEIALGIRLAALVMVVLYVLDRGRSLAEPDTAKPVSSTFRTQFVENLRVGAAAGVWFVAALVALVVGVAPDTLVFVFTGTGVGVVLLYAIAVGIPRIRGERSGSEKVNGAND